MHAQTCGEKEVVRELENDQHVSLGANVLDSLLFSSNQSFWDPVFY